MVEVATLIEGVTVTPVQKIHHPKGDIYHALKCTDTTFSEFGEAYFTTVHNGDTKGWKKHTKMRMNLVVPVGTVTFFLHSEESGKTATITLGAQNYQRLTIEPGVWVAFRGGNDSSDSGLNLVLNIASLPHDPDEAENVELSAFPLQCSL